MQARNPSGRLFSPGEYVGLNIDNRLGFVFSAVAEPIERRQYFSHLLFFDAPSRTDQVAVIVTLPGASVEATRVASTGWVFSAPAGASVASVFRPASSVWNQRSNNGNGIPWRVHGSAQDPGRYPTRGTFQRRRQQVSGEPG